MLNPFREPPPAAANPFRDSQPPQLDPHGPSLPQPQQLRVTLRKEPGAKGYGLGITPRADGSAGGEALLVERAHTNDPQLLILVPGL